MEAIRLTLNSAQLAPIIDLPASLQDREVDIIVLPHHGEARIATKAENGRRSVKSLKGILKHYANPDLVKLEKDAWAQAAAEKYIERITDA